MGNTNGRTDAPGRHMREAYAARIRAARAFAGLDQQTLATHFGVSKVTIKRMERGERETSMDELAEIAALCRVPLAFMVNGFAEDDVQAESVALTAARLLRREVGEAFDRFDTVADALLQGAEADAAAREALDRLMGQPAS